jgi:hypothetical protein
MFLNTSSGALDTVQPEDIYILIRALLKIFKEYAKVKIIVVVNDDLILLMIVACEF